MTVCNMASTTNRKHYEKWLCENCNLSKPRSIFNLPSVLRRCWSGGRKGIRPVNNRVVGCWRGYLSGSRCRLAYGPADATATHSLASVKSRLVLALWYRLTRLVPDKGPLNGGGVCVAFVKLHTRNRITDIDVKCLQRKLNHVRYFSSIWTHDVAK